MGELPTDLFITAFVGANMFAGILLAELNNSEIPARVARFSPVLCPPLLAISLLFMSFPADAPHWAPWSLTLLRWHHLVAPRGADTARFWPTIGAQLLCLTIICSPHLRRALNHPILLWLGRISFPLYLLHGPLLRSVLSWLLFAGQNLVAMEADNSNEVIMRYPLPRPWVYVVALPVFFAVLGVLCHYWTEKIEPHFGTITKKAEDIMSGRTSRLPTLPVRKD